VCGGPNSDDWIKSLVLLCLLCGCAPLHLREGDHWKDYKVSLITLENLTALKNLQYISKIFACL
jgi:hypothetical protein